VFALALVAALLLVAGCGGGDENGDAAGQDAEAKAKARTVATELEVCFVEQADYRACTKPADARVELEADVTSFKVTVASESGNTFSLAKAEDGSTEQTCEVKGSEDGGCADGTW
jgi:hypothetical protein